MTQFLCFRVQSTVYIRKNDFLCFRVFANVVLLFVGFCFGYLAVFGFRGFDAPPAEGRAVFWELGLAEKEKDPNDPTGKRFQAICRCKVDKDDPTITCNKKIGICLI